MKNNLLFDFTVDKSTNRVFVTREFDAGLDLVWKAFTDADTLDQWWAPKPWSSRTKYMKFTPGGRRFYAMCGPEGEEHWAIQDFSKISPKINFQFTDAFVDKDENITGSMPSSEWNLDFNETKGITTVSITITHKSLADLEMIIQMGFSEGFTMTLNYLDTLLTNITGNQPMYKTQITIQAEVSAPIEKVWERWTKPEHITKWNFASDDWHCPAAVNDLTPGGKMNWRMEAKDGSSGFDFEAIFDEVILHKKIAYTMLDGRKAVTEFSSEGGKTKITTVFDAETENSVELQQEGWQAILNNFKKHAESK